VGYLEPISPVGIAEGKTGSQPADSKNRLVAIETTAGICLPLPPIKKLAAVCQFTQPILGTYYSYESKNWFQAENFQP
jgi:hypothetical protein